jgi:purine-binding chemotaxis protein CheW
MSDDLMQTPISTDAVEKEDSMEMLVFQLGPRNFSIDIGDVAEIIRYKEPTQVPNTVFFLDGIISYRGKVIAVINGRKRFGYPPVAPDLRTSIIIVRDGSEIYGILVDFSSLVIEINPSDISPASLPEAEANMIRGMFTHKNQEIYLLNLPVFLQF